MGNSLFKLTSLNLNGIRSAARKGVEAWLEKAKPDCICVQEIKAQAPDVVGTFDQLAGLTGHFHYAEKKGYSGVGIYTRQEPSDVLIGFDGGEFDASSHTGSPYKGGRPCCHRRPKSREETPKEGYEARAILPRNHVYNAASHKGQAKFCCVAIVGIIASVQQSCEWT